MSKYMIALLLSLVGFNVAYASHIHPPDTNPMSTGLYAVTGISLGPHGTKFGGFGLGYVKEHFFFQTGISYNNDDLSADKQDVDTHYLGANLWLGYMQPLTTRMVNKYGIAAEINKQKLLINDQSDKTTTATAHVIAFFTGPTIQLMKQLQLSFYVFPIQYAYIGEKQKNIRFFQTGGIAINYFF